MRKMIFNRYLTQDFGKQLVVHSPIPFFREEVRMQSEFDCRKLGKITLKDQGKG